MSIVPASLREVLSLGEWVELALCAQADPEVFFPEQGDSARVPKRICSRCPVAAECLLEALEAPPSTAGVWGGLTATERRHLRSLMEPMEENCDE